MKIIPMRDLKNTVQIEKLCSDEGSPVFVTKNGYGSLVVMNIECFEQITNEEYKKEMFALNDSYEKIQKSSDYVPGNVYVYDKEKLSYCAKGIRELSKKDSRERKISL